MIDRGALRAREPRAVCGRMRYTFASPGFAPLEVPDDSCLGLYAPREGSPAVSEDELIREALEHSIGSPPLEEAVQGSSDVLIVVDDNTRPTPAAKILPQVISLLKRGGVRERDISILVALGTHRSMTEDEKRKKFGPEICERFRIDQHRYDAEETLTSLGTTPGGTEVVVNTRVLEAEFVVGVGSIMPHRVAGFSGGSKIIQPGVCGAVTTGQTHWLSAQYETAAILGRAENPVRREIEAVGERVGLNYIINTVLDGAGRVLGCVAGHPIRAHRRGCRRSQQVSGVQLPGPADIVVADCHPFDPDLWQAVKGLFAADVATRDGGVIIMVAALQEGVAPHHRVVEQLGYRPGDEIRQMVKSGQLKDLTVAAHLLHCGRIIRDRVHGILVSPGVGRKESEHLGFRWAPSAQEALAMAFELVGGQPSVACFKNAGELLPLVPGVNQEGDATS